MEGRDNGSYTEKQGIEVGRDEQEEEGEGGREG